MHSGWLDSAASELEAFGPTFQHMVVRRLERQFGGTIRQPQKLRTVSIIVFVLLCAGLMGFSLRDGVHVTFSTSTAPLFCVIALCLLFVAISHLEVLRWCIYWVLLGAVALLLVALAEGYHIKGFFDFSTNGSFLRMAVYVITVALIVTTLLIWLLLFGLYPELVKRGIMRPARLKARPGVRRGDESSSRAFEYFAWSWSFPFGRRRQVCTYEGDICPLRGMPHGWGMWCDDHHHGERLQGWWENGVPVGPFHSSTVDRGWAFSCVQLAVCSIASQPWNEKRWWPVRAPALTWGVVSAEVSVAGHFFRHLPRSRMVLPLSSTTGPQEAISALAHAEAGGSTTESLTISVNHQGTMHVSGHTRVPGASSRVAGDGPPAVGGVVNRRRGPGRTSMGALALGGGSVTESIAVNLSLDAWGEGSLHVPGFERANEAMVWISGYNTHVDEVARAVGQLLALGSFPAWIKPVLFSWPGGSHLTYLQALQLCAASETSADFVSFLEGLLDRASIQHVHIVCHSCGVRILMAALPELVPRLRERGIALASCSFLNPDYPLDDFVSSPNGFSSLRSICSLITLYADKDDTALWLSEIAHGGAAALGRYPHAIVAPVPCRSASSDSGVWGRPPRHSVGNMAAVSSSSGHVGNVATGLSGGADCLDLDVIDSTWLDANVHGLRHSYFAVNRWVVDDLFEVLTTRKRASGRTTRLRHLNGNVFTFMAPPKYIYAT